MKVSAATTQRIVTMRIPTTRTVIVKENRFNMLMEENTELREELQLYKDAIILYSMRNKGFTIKKNKKTRIVKLIKC